MELVVSGLVFPEHPKQVQRKLVKMQATRWLSPRRRVATCLFVLGVFRHLRLGLLGCKAGNSWQSSIAVSDGGLTAT